MTAKSAANGKRPFRMVAGISKLEDLADGFLGLGSFAVGAKTVYYVDGNCGSDTNGGTGGWTDAKKTLAAALAASHADIASGSQGWAARNVIFARGDTFTEDLVLLADKTDIIGVGSYDHRSQPGVVGNHVPVGTFMGTRFINMCFRSPAAGGDIWTVPTTVTGLSFLGCKFDGASATAATGAIIITTSESFTVQDCIFTGAYSDAVIELVGTEFNSLLITDNIIQGGNVGIDVPATVTTSIRSGYILRNTCNVVLEGIKEASGKLYVHNNDVVTAANKGTAGAGAIVAGAKMMLNNHVSCGDVANAIVPAEGTL
jgi:hypothetical protein